jgi:hypothetical protein
LRTSFLELNEGSSFGVIYDAFDGSFAFGLFCRSFVYLSFICRSFVHLRSFTVFFRRSFARVFSFVVRLFVRRSFDRRSFARRSFMFVRRLFVFVCLRCRSCVRSLFVLSPCSFASFARSLFVLLRSFAVHSFAVRSLAFIHVRSPFVCVRSLFFAVFVCRSCVRLLFVHRRS